ncbi:hypothetical protein [Tropicimonas sediminicola]|uniref:Uncharacterized protein n=1 Tax=Tropicimonas sediminicola TaxID=1031541 RepID=A0A239CGF4_9RHOB|nr:hypothetical protein [Tropicimonas sediminicola]SNS19180.1 hypothetical protein SAMN05421757_101276 [Tropicimonas sediminicola]
MPHPFIDSAHLRDIHADRFRQDAFLLHGSVNLPDNPAVRAEIAAMLREIAADPPPPRPPARPLIARLQSWVPRWFGWLRAMPLP